MNVKIIRVALLLVFLYLFYWTIIYDVTVWNKTMEEIIDWNPGNLTILGVLGVLLGSTFHRSVKSRVQAWDLDFIPFFGGSTESEEIPEAWLSKKERARMKVEAKRQGSRQKQKTVKMVYGGRKFRMPGLLRFKQVLFGFLLIFNLVLSQGVLIARDPSRYLFWFFLLNAWVCLEYLWKTRKVAQLMEAALKK